MKHILIIVVATFILAACGGDEQGTSEKKAATSAPQKTMQSSDNAADGKKMDEMMIVDHSMDEIEFEIRRSLNGVKRMIEQYKEEGFDTAELEAKKEKLEKELKDLLSK